MNRIDYVKMENERFVKNYLQIMAHKTFDSNFS